VSVEFQMRISTVDKSTTKSSLPGEVREQFVWDELTPRLIDPTRLAIIEALLWLQRPLAASDLAPVLGAPKELVRYHCRVLARAGVLEIVDVRLRPGRGGDESVFDFPVPSPSEPAPSSSVATA
jgi:hypothetical protein